VSGRKWIAVNESYSNYIKGVSAAEPEHPRILFDMIKSPEATARLTWSRGAARDLGQPRGSHRASATTAGAGASSIEPP